MRKTLSSVDVFKKTDDVLYEYLWFKWNYHRLD